MAFNIHYRPLCSVSIRHGFHLNKGATEFDDLDETEQQRKLKAFDIFDDLRLHLPADSRRALAGLGMLLKPTPTGFIVGTEVSKPQPEVFVPRRVPTQGFRLRIALIARAPQFWDYTNLDLGPRSRTVYYLSNRAGSLGGDFPFLSSPPAIYSSGTPYEAGDLVRPIFGAGSRFLAVRSGTHGAPVSTDPNWLEIGPRNYLNGSDRIALQPPVFPIRAPLDRAAAATIDLLADDGSTYPLGSPLAPPGQTIDEFTADARNVPAGHYLLRVEGNDGSGDSISHSERIYIDSEFSSIGTFAIVELFHEPGETLGLFRFYDESAAFRLREPGFVVNLLNRHTFWRYHFPTPPEPGTDLGDLEMVGEQFVTKRVMPLTRGVERVNFGDDKLLPNPGAGGIIPEPDRVYSDIFVHINP